MTDGVEPRRRPRSSSQRVGRDPHLSRARALRILFQADLRRSDPLTVLATVTDDPRARAVLDDAEVDDDIPPVDERTRTLVTGCAESRAQIDTLIARFARGWQLSRMPAVDRTILRLATHELMTGTTSAAVVIDEAVEFAKAWSTGDSSRYVNGVLESIRQHLASTDGDAEA